MDESIERLQAALADVEHDLKIATKNKQMFKSNEDGFADHNYKASIWEGIYLELKFRNCTWEQIGNELNADARTIRRWHKDALQKVKIPPDAIEI